MNIRSVPDKITRQQLKDLISSLGADPDLTVRMEITPEFISIEVLSLNDQGKPFSVSDGDEKIVATSLIMIQVEEEDQDSL